MIISIWELGNCVLERHKSLVRALGTRIWTVQFSSVQSLSRDWLCNPMDCSTPGFPVHHQLLELAHVHRVSDAIQSSHPLSSPSPPTFNLSQHQGFFQWVNSSHQVAKVLEFQLQHQSFQWTEICLIPPRISGWCLVKKQQMNEWRHAWERERREGGREKEGRKEMIKQSLILWGGIHVQALVHALNQLVFSPSHPSIL